MPLVGATAATAGIEFENGRRSLDGTLGRMRDEVAETLGKALLPGIVEMRLVAEEHHLVPQQDLVDRRDRLLRQVAGEPNVPDLCADASGKRDNIGIRDDLLYGGKSGHGNLFL